MEEIECVIIGAGVVGLAIAKELARKFEILVIEKNSSFGQETSSRHSEVIHAGIYYNENFLKTRLCVEGNKLLYEICDKHNIKYRNIKKLIVAKNEKEEERILKLYEQGKKNGVSGLKILSGKEIKKYEPDIVPLKSALLSETTGIIDSHQLMKYFETEAKCNGALFAYNNEVTGIEKTNGKYKIIIKDTYSNITEVLTQIVINSAGLYSDKIANLAGIGDYKLYFCKGEYFNVSGIGNRYLNILIYLASQEKFTSLGIHTVVDTGGRLKLGPSDFYVDKIDYSVNENNRILFYNAIKDYLPFIEEKNLQPDMAGIRPKLQKKGENEKDFLIKEESGNGFPNFINLIGIESPGLTSSPAIAKHILNILSQH